MLHTLYQQSLRHRARFFIEYFAIDLIMDGGACRGVLALDMASGTLHRFLAQATILATGGYATAAGWCCARGCRSRTWSSCSSTRPGSTAQAA
jgi:succinate dehydrogenase / fumarate reductase flavoprotein subunit